MDAPAAAPQEQPSTGRWRRPALLLVLASVLFRLPALINARGVLSDAAIVGVQAMHLLRGEWSWFLWGAGYQASFDALMVALGFAITGPSALTLMVVPLLGHLAATLLAYDLLRRRLGRWAAAAACLPLVFAPQAINGVALYAPRQWSITSVFLAAWLLDRGAARLEAGGRRAWAWFAGGAFFAAFALYLDLFTLQMMIGAGAFALACAVRWPPRWRELAGSMLGLALGAAAGLGIVLWSYSQPMASAAKAGLTLSRLAPNWELLTQTCLPWLLGAKVFIPGAHLYPDLWEPPLAVKALELAGAASLLLAIAFAGIALFSRRIPWGVRRAGGLGFAIAASSIGGFLASSMPSDMWSARYLAPLVWFAPFALAPAASLLRPRRFALALSPYAVTAAIGGWLAFGPYVDGPLPVRDPRGIASDEAEVGRVLREKGVHHAAAQYWLSYRLTLLWREDPVVIPLAGWEDRYPPFREAFASAPVVAYVFHPSEPRARPEPYEAALRQGGARYERLDLRGFTVLIQDRR